MNDHANSFRRPKTKRLALIFPAAFLALLVTSVPAAAATVWNGPPTTFSKTGADDPTQAAHQDRITPNVWITRGGSQGIYNIKTESFFTHGVSVVTPVPTTLNGMQRPLPSSFQFNYSATAGLKYVVQRSMDLKNWISLATNTNTSNPTLFQDNTASGTPAFYRVGRLPNP